MTISVAAFRTRFPEFEDGNDYPTDRIEMFIGDSSLLYMGTEEARWNGTYDIAQAYLVAHLLKQSELMEAGENGVGGGPVSGVSAGGVSVSYAVSDTKLSLSDSQLASTSYGAQYIQIRNSIFRGAVTVAGC